MFAIDHVPKKPGCYLFKDTVGHILYVGKAKNLLKRIQSYTKKDHLDEKTLHLVQKIAKVDVIITDTEVEALLLESTLIKKHQPRYNINLKDSKGYAYLRITSEEYPRLLIARGKQGKGQYFGPFVSGQERDYILQFLKKTFRLRTCKRLPKRPCLRYHIHLCDAPCINHISKTEYQKNIKQVELVLHGKIDEAVYELETAMKHFSEQQSFEQALTCRNQITALRHLQERQKVQRQKTYDEDIINYSIKQDTVYLILFNIYKGTLTNKHEFVFAHTPDFLEEFLVQYYVENPIPKELILPEEIDESIHSFLEQQKQQKVYVGVPKKGEKKQLLTLVLKNIEITFFAAIEKVNTLQQVLHLQEAPQVIECFDISHLSGTHTVGSMVQFRNGVPDKYNYRRFRIRTVEGIDDVKAIEEVVRRRYQRLQKENERFPDLIIIDGGKGQLQRAYHVLQELGVRIPIISLAKRLEEIYLPCIPIPLQLNKKNKALLFLQEIRDEAHRFAISYNRLLRKKEVSL